MQSSKQDVTCDIIAYYVEVPYDDRCSPRERAQAGGGRPFINGHLTLHCPAVYIQRPDG
ncbi:unnamed protein product, partial [Staurois parvus]